MWPPDHLEDLCTLQSVTSHWLKAQSSQGAENWITKQTKKSQLCMYFSKQHFFLFFFGLNWIVLLSNNRLRGWSRSSCRTAHTSTLTLFYCFSAVCILQNLYLNLSGAGDGPSCENKKREQDGASAFNVIWKLQLKIHSFQGKENGTETVTFVEKFLMTFWNERYAMTGDILINLLREEWKHALPKWCHVFS